MKKNAAQERTTLILEERGSLTVTSVSDIGSFDERNGGGIYRFRGELTGAGSGLPHQQDWRGCRRTGAGGRDRFAQLFPTSRFPAVDFCEDVSIDDDRCYCGKGNDAVFPVHWFWVPDCLCCMMCCASSAEKPGIRQLQFLWRILSYFLVCGMVTFGFILKKTTVVRCADISWLGKWSAG